MDTNDVLNYLSKAKEPPADETAFVRWLGGDDAIQFLAQPFDGQCPVYISSPHFFLYSVFVPNDALTDGYGADLSNWNFSPSSGWGYSYSSTVDEVQLEPPLGLTETMTLEAGEPLLFLRFFEGRPRGQQEYAELNQKFAHISDAHWIEDQQAYCRLDENGHLFAVFTASRIDDSLICMADVHALNFYMFITKQILIQVFDVTRWRNSTSFASKSHGKEMVTLKDHELFARRELLGDKDIPDGGYVRGAQVVRMSESAGRMIKLVRGVRLKIAAYETFIIHDFKNGSVREWSCDPEQLGNYFTESDLPYATSPVYFRPEVLMKYKQDQERFMLTEVSITCRSSWHLQSYGINDSGQVFTYAGDLNKLPLSEQLYWKSFNEPPKAGLPESTIATDFLGKWADEEKELDQLRHILDRFPPARHDGKPILIWSLGKTQEESLDKLHYVVTQSSKEWGDEILHLSEVVVGGLQTKRLRRLAEALGCNDPTHQSLVLLRDCLSARRVDAEVVKEVCTPLFELRQVRSTASPAHLGTVLPKGNLAVDYRRRLAEVSAAMQQLARLVEAGVLDLPVPPASVAPTV